MNLNEEKELEDLKHTNRLKELDKQAETMREEYKLKHSLLYKSLGAKR